MTKEGVGKHSREDSENGGKNWSEAEGFGEK